MTDRVQACCVGCDWHVSVTTLAQLLDAARRHDDAPANGHIVRLHAGRPGPWPTSEREFAAIAAPDPVGDLVDQVAALTVALDRLEHALLDDSIRDPRIEDHVTPATPAATEIHRDLTRALALVDEHADSAYAGPVDPPLDLRPIQQAIERKLATSLATVELCPSCDSPIHPATSECRCT